MPRKPTTTSTTPAAPAAAPVEPTPAAAVSSAVEPPKVRKPRAPKVVAVEVAAPAPVEVKVEEAAAVVVPALESAPAEAESAPAVRHFRNRPLSQDDLDVEKKFADLSAELVSYAHSLDELKAHGLKLVKQLAALSKMSVKRRNELLVHQRKPSSGKTKSMSYVKVSDKLSKLLGYSVDAVVSRRQVSADLVAYVKSNGLETKGDGRRWTPNADLESVLGKADNIGYFTINTYLKAHLTKTSPPESAAAVAVESA